LSVEIKKYHPSQFDTWNDFVKNSKNGTFIIDRKYMDYHKERFEDYSLMFYKNNELVALLPANIMGETIYSHQGLTYGGLIINTKIKTSVVLEIFNHLINYLQAINISKLIYKTIPHIYHKYSAEEDLYALFINNAILIRRDVSTVINIENKIGFSKSKKCGLSKAKQNNLHVKQSYDFKKFIEIEEEVLKKHNTKPVHNYEEINILQNNFPKNIKLFSSFIGEEMLAGVITYESDYFVHLQYMGSTKSGMNMGAIDIIINYLLEYVYINKKYFDFGISTECYGKYLNEGLISQKEMFGGRAICYDHYQLNISK
jgi:hypothetical protein